MNHFRKVLSSTLFVLLAADARAQQPSAPGGGSNAPSSGGSGVTAPGEGAAPSSGATTAPAAGAGAATGGTTVYVPPYGFPQPGTNINGHLPSSSQPSNDINVPSDNFDLGTGAGGPTVMRGNESGSMAFTPPTPMVTPQAYVVQRGDTLWDICQRYFEDPWQWPRIWSYNPELANPHWIYPGDQIRLLGPGGAPGGGGGGGSTGQGGAGTGPNGNLNTGPVTLGNGGFVGRRGAVPRTTVFLRDQGYIDDPAKDTWGEVGGSPDDQMLLGDGNNVYLTIEPGHDVANGQELTVFRPLGPPTHGEAKGTVVAILGTARVDQWDPKARVARAKLTESLNVIERGAKIGPVSRRFDVVPPVRNETEVWAHVAASLYPHVIYGQNQVVFIDKGGKDGLAPGNRLFVVTHGDAYQQTLQGASEFANADVRYESEKPATIEKAGREERIEDSKLPDEVIGEIRVLRVRDHTAACLVVSSTREIEPGQRVVARKGY